MVETVKNRSELIFLYDIKDGNPNGDPMDQNKPRIDEETGINIVTDVRLKRTIRDYLYDFKGQEILIRTISLKEGSLAIQDAKTRALDFRDENLKKAKFKEQLDNIEKNILEQCIDVRLFGATLPIEIGKDSSSFTRTGPVQFNVGRSLHQVEIKHIKGTGAFASSTAKEGGKGKDKLQQTFRDEFILNYSLIGFHGLINENAAKQTLLTEADVQLLLEGMWNGTKSLISRTKVGQMPRLLLQVVYSEANYHIGDLIKGIKLVANGEELAIRGPEDYILDITQLLAQLAKNKEKIKTIYYLIDEQISFQKEGKKCDFVSALKEAIKKEPEEISFS